MHMRRRFRHRRQITPLPLQQAQASKPSIMTRYDKIDFQFNFITGSESGINGFVARKTRFRLQQKGAADYEQLARSRA